MRKRTPFFEIFNKAIRKHLTVVGIAQIIFNALWICSEIICFFILRARNLATDAAYLPRIPVHISVFTSIVIMINIVGIAGGYGVLKEKSWAWRVVVIVSIIELVGFPVGTIIGIYSLWVLFKKEVKELFRVKGKIPSKKNEIS